MPMRTGKQTALLIFGIVKILGAAMFCILGIAMFVSEMPPEFVSSFIDGYEEASGTYLSYSDVTGAIKGAGIAILVIGLGGVAHGVLNFLGARAGAGSSAVGAGIFGILGCVLDVLFVIATGFIGLFMLALNVAQTIIAFMVSSEAKNPAGMYPGYGQPGMPVQGGYPGYSQQQAMPPQSAPYPGYPQPGMPAQQDAYQGYPPQNGNYPTL